MNNKLYNLDYLRSISGGDDEFINEMISTFVLNTPDEIQKIRELAAKENWQKVGEESHRFASSLLFLGLEDLKTIAVDIEERGIEGSETEKIPFLLEKLGEGCQQVISQLKHDYNVLLND